MQDDLAAISNAHQAHYGNSESAAKPSSIDSVLKSQLKDSLHTSIRTGTPTPRLDVVTATDKLQTLSQLLTDPRSTGVIEKLMTHIQVADPIALGRQGAIDKLIQQLMVAPPPPTAAPAPKKITKSDNTHSIASGRKTRTVASETSPPLSRAIKSFIRFIFG
jgi:hypothetical protein